MQKDFITATPDSGGSGTTTVTATALRLLATGRLLLDFRRKTKSTPRGSAQ
jgi:hypothetical protein